MFVKLCTVRRVYTYEIYHYTVYYSIARVCIQVISIGNSMLKTDFHFIHSFILEFDSLHGMPIHNAYTEYTHPFVNKTISRIHALVNTSSPYMDVTHTHTHTAFDDEQKFCWNDWRAAMEVKTSHTKWTPFMVGALFFCSALNNNKKCEQKLKMEQCAMHRLIAKIVNDQAFIHQWYAIWRIDVCVEKRHSATATPTTSHIPAANK